MMDSSKTQQIEYSLLKDFKLDYQNDDEQLSTFSLSFWLYLPTNSTRFPATILSLLDVEKEAPFLVLDASKKMQLLHSPIIKEGTPDLANLAPSKQVPYASADMKFPLPLDRWVHVGCEIDANSARLFINGDMVGVNVLSSSLTNDSNRNVLKRATLIGTSGNNNVVLGYFHNAKVSPKEALMKDLYVKDPPLELSIKISSASGIEEGSRGVWSIVGGKASCRQSFSLDVLLLNALGQLVNKEMEIIASLVYNDNGESVERTENEAEAPLLTICDGLEIASCDCQRKLLNGVASFKLKISQLSSECNNRLFRLKFDIPKVDYPFLKAFSLPIHCISRSRNVQPSTIISKKPSSATIHRLNSPQIFGLENVFSDPHNNGLTDVKPTSVSIGIKSEQEKACQVFKADVPLDKPDEDYISKGKVINMVTDVKPTSVSIGIKSEQEKACQVFKADVPLDKPDEDYFSKGRMINKVQSANGLSFKGKEENHEEKVCTPSELESTVPMDSQSRSMSNCGNKVSDVTVFKYCLGSINDRAIILKELVSSSQELEDFAQQVSLYSGCVHHSNQILMAKKLIQEGTKAWDIISKNNDVVPWENTIIYIEAHYMKISCCTSRELSQQDFEILRRIAGCREYMTRENFERLWCWLYPVALSISRDPLKATWVSTSPKWIEGFITKEEAEFSLQSPGGILQERGTFIVRFPTSRSWPHPDAGSLVITYVGGNYTIRHRILNIDNVCSSGVTGTNLKPLHDMLLTEPELSRLGTITRSY